jgi:hypothetical protein
VSSDSSPYSNTIRLDDSFSIEFLSAKLGTSFPIAETRRPCNITRLGEYLYYLSYDGATFALNRSALDGSGNIVLFSTNTDKLDSFLIVDETEIVLMIEREPELGTPHFKTELICYNAKTKAITSFAERFGLGEISAGDITSLVYSNGYYYFNKSVYGNDRVGVILLRASLSGNIHEELRNNAYQYDIVGENLVFFDSDISIRPRGEGESVPFITLQGEGALNNRNAFFVGLELHIVVIDTYNNEAYIYVIDVAEQKLIKAVTLAHAEHLYERGYTNQILPYEDVYLVRYVHPEDITDFTIKNTLSLTFFDGSGTITTQYPPIDPLEPFEWNAESFTRVDGTLYYLAGQRNSDYILTSLQLNSAQAIAV